MTILKIDLCGSVTFITIPIVTKLPKVVTYREKFHMILQSRGIVILISSYVI